MKILKRDNDILICVKPSGILSTDEPGGLPELLRQELKISDIKSVHRLDQITSGLMVYALNAEAASALGKTIMDGKFKKEYYAVIHGSPENPSGRYEDLLRRDPEEKKTYVVKKPGKGIQKAILEYEVLQQKKGLSLVKITLITGRTHQIRAQFASRSLPLFGDKKYGAPEENSRTALWSCSLEFPHPESGDTVKVSLAPPDMAPWSAFDVLQLSPAEDAMPKNSAGEIFPDAADARHKKEKQSSNTAETCPLMKKCGGCQLMYMPYEDQLRYKQKKEKNLLEKFGRVEKIIGMDDPYHYRNKVHAAFGYDIKGKIISGVYQTSSHKIVPVSDCLLEDRKADEIINGIRKMMPDFKMTPYDEYRGQGFLRHVLVRRSAATKQIMVVLVVTSPIFKLQKPFLKALLEKYPEITTVVLNQNDKYTPLVLGEKEKVIYGPGYIEDILCGCRFRISPKSFYQINSRQTGILYSTAIELAKLTGKETVLDAYCGTGTIGIAAAGKAKQVAGVELNRDAVHDAIINAKINNIANCWFTCGDAGEFMVRSAEEKRKCDVVFMDPPRAGSDENFLVSLIKMSPDRIVYISCNPETLARDLEILTGRGKYIVRRIQPVDMFPHTEHVETVVLMSRVKE